MFGVYVTHPQVLIDPEVPVPDWGLSPLGRERAERVAQAPWVKALTRIVSSEERKAQETAAILAGAAGVAVQVRPGLQEIDRSATGYLSHDEHEAAADALFAEPDRSHRGWESARVAQARIARAVAEVLDAHPVDEPIAVVGHGGVGTLLRLALAGAPIRREEDQPAGGGCLFAFDLRTRRPLTGWIAMETWQGLAERNVND